MIDRDVMLCSLLSPINDTGCLLPPLAARVRLLLTNVAGAFEDTPCLQLALDCFKITLEEDVIHYPAIEESLRDNPQKNPQTLTLEDISHDRHTGIDDKEDEVIEEYLKGITRKESDEHQYISQW